jgi:hypothetical protein
LTQNGRIVLVGLIVVLILAITSPFLFAIGYSGYGGWTVRMQALFWFFDNQPPHIRFGINGLWEMAQYLPFVSLRPFGVYQLYRYYR